VSIIIDNNDGASSKCRVENEEDGNDEEMDEEEEERLGAWIYKQSRTVKLLSDKVLSSSLPSI
jgi:hypothetical protein